MWKKRFARKSTNIELNQEHQDVSGVQLMSFLKKPSVVALAMFCVFVLWGCLLLYSVRTFTSGAVSFVLRQLLWLLTGAVVFFIASLVPFPFYLKYARNIFFLSCGFLLCVLFLGSRVNGMSGWFLIADSIHVQPSEFAKGALVLYLVSLSEVYYEGECGVFGARLRQFFRMIWPALLCCVLVMLEPDFGSATLFFVAFLIVYYVTGGSKLLTVLTFLVCGAVFTTIILCVPYARDRIVAFFSDNPSWHIMQFRYALAYGGLIGEPGGAAMWANAYLPLPHSDSLFATLVEAAGFIGGIFVLGLFLVLGYLFNRMALKKGLEFQPAVFIFSIGLLYVVQALLHISVNVVLLPTTGLTLPFLSYGGSSLVSVLFYLGVAFAAFRTENADGRGGWQ